MASLLEPAMRFLCFLFLILFTGVVAGFAYYNQEPLTVRYWEYSYTSSIAVIVGAGYVLGMVSGWTMVRMIRRSANSVIHSLDRQVVR